MNAAELLGSLEILNLTKSEAARLLGVQYRTVHRWTTGEQAVPEAAALALRLKIENDRLRGLLRAVQDQDSDKLFMGGRWHDLAET